ncbi:hypothetical protein DL93DRAFT_2072083 [Clavulina sp. PMI_390]|nr:hypothetical protein DL93DRAFT_2072083 [Clavulina sp. PMI_390]
MSCSQSTSSSCSDVLKYLASCHDLHRYFASVFTWYDPEQTSEDDDALDIRVDCFLCGFKPRDSPSPPSIAAHIHKRHISEATCEHVKGTTTPLQLVLLYHYTSVRARLSRSTDPQWARAFRSEKELFYKSYRTYWPGKEFTAPDQATFPILSSLVQKVAVREYMLLAKHRKARAKARHERQALEEAEQNECFVCHCRATFATLDDIVDHLQAENDAESELSPRVRRLLPKKHYWTGNQDCRVVDNTRSFSALHRKVVHRWR